MSGTSKIEWTDATWNPVTGCTKVSPGCAHCYAETFAERWRGIPGHPYEQGFDLKLHPDRMELPLHWKKPRRIFVNSMSDLFHEKIPFEFIKKVFSVMNHAKTFHHTFQVLTKRPERFLDFFQWVKPLLLRSNIWIGTSVESIEQVVRLDFLRRIPTENLFVSFEPLLGPMTGANISNIRWVIVGGESGPGARIMDPKWVREIRDDCHYPQRAFFFKQWGGVRKKEAGRILDGRTWDEMPPEMEGK